MRNNIILFKLIISTLLILSPLQAQDISTIVMKADNWAKKSNWEEAYKTYRQATELHKEERLLKIFKDEAAYIWYYRALSAENFAKSLNHLLDEATKLKRKLLLEDAVVYYGKCNSLGKIDTNPRKNYALFNKGKILNKLGKHEEALTSFKKFRTDYNKNIPKERALIYGKQKVVLINLQTISFLKQKEPDLAHGEKGITWLIQTKNRQQYKIPSHVVITSFHAYCDAINKLAQRANKNKKKDEIEKFEKLITSFIYKQRGLLKTEPYTMHRYTHAFLNLSMQQRALGMHKASFAIQGLLPNSIAIQEDLEQKLRNLDKERFAIDFYNKIDALELKKGITDIKKRKKEGKTHEITQHLSMAAYYDSEDNHRSAFAIYEMLELYHSNNSDREDALFHLVRTANNIGAVEKTNVYGMRFLDLFPKSKHVSSVEQFMLFSLFNNQQYTQCIKTGKQIITSIKPNTKQHDIALYCIAASYFYLSKHTEAAPLLAKHLKLYGKGKKQKSQYLTATQYLDGANQAYLENWTSAATKLEKYIQDFPDKKNSYLPLAKYELARCLSTLGEYSKAAAQLDGICSNYQSCPIIDRAYVLRGKNFQNLDAFEKAYTDYTKGLNLSKEANNSTVESEALYYLVLLLGNEQQKEGEQKTKNFKLTIKYYTEFWKKHNKSPYRIYVAVSGLPALIANGRANEGMRNLKQVISDLAQKQHSKHLDSAISTYTEKYLMLKGNTAESLRKHYLTDFVFRQEQVYARSLVKLSLIEVYGQLEKEAIRHNNEPNAKKWSASAQGQIDEIARMDKSALNNRTLLLIGNNILNNANNIAVLAQANDFFEQALLNVRTKKDEKLKNEALLGSVKTMIATNNKVKIPDVLVTLNALAKEANLSDSIKKQILMYLTKLNAVLGNHKLTIAHGTKFLKTFNGPRFRPQVRLDVANALFDLNQLKKSLLHYQSIVIANTQSAKYSCPAILRIIEISNKQGRVYSGYKAGSSYIRMCEKSFNQAAQNGKMKLKVAQIWSKIQETVNNLEAHPDVVEGLKNEADERRLRKAVAP